jgi:hypothetical protein
MAEGPSEQAEVTQVVKINPCLYVARRLVSFRVHMCPPTDRILSQLNPFCALRPHFLPSMPRYV